MSNITTSGKQDAYETELAASIDNAQVTLTVVDAPGFTVAGNSVYGVIDPKNSSREGIEITNIVGTTLTITRGLPAYEGGASTASAHSGGATIILSDNWQTFEDIKDAVNDKLDSDGGNPTTSYDLNVTGNAFRHRMDGNDMKFTDENNAELTLSTLAAAAGADQKCRISAADTTNGFLQGKFNAGDGLDEAIGTPGGDETLDVSVDVTDFIDTSYGLTENANDIRINLDANGGLEFNAGALQAKLIAADGLESAAGGLSVDVTDIIDTAFGLTEAGGDIQVNLDAVPGLEFNAGAVRVLVPADGGVALGATGLTLDLTHVGYTAGPLATVISDVSATEAEIDQALDGISANVTFTNLNTLTAGPASDADALHTHVSANDTVVDTPYTAREDITIGHPVSKTDVNDEVENTIVSAPDVAGTESTFSSAGTITLVKSCYCADNKVAVIYKGSTGPVGNIIIGTVALDKTITWGTPVDTGLTFEAITDIKYMEDDKVAFIYRITPGNELYARIATVVGTVPTMGTASMVSTDSITTAALAIIDTDKLVVAYKHTDLKGYVDCATVSGTTISAWGGAVEFLTTGVGNEVNDIAIAKSSTDKAVIFCQNDDDVDKGKGILAVATGTAMGVATEVEIDANASSGFSAEYITDGKVLVSWRGGATGFCQARVASVAGLILTYPTAVTVVNGVAVTAPTGVTLTDSTTGFVAYNEAAATDGKSNSLAIAGTVLTLGTQYSFNGGTNNVASTTVAKVSAKGKIMIAYEDTADANEGHAEVFQEYDNTATIVGFATATVSATDTVSARSKGVIGSQTCVAGTSYYIGANGISATNTYGIAVGVGKSATELDIDIDARYVSSGLQATGAIDASGNTDIVITTQFQPKAIELYFSYLIPGAATGWYTGKMIFNGTTGGFAQYVADTDSSTVPTLLDFLTDTSGFTLASSGATRWSVVVSVNAVSATGFTIRLAATKTGAVANFTTSFGWVAY